jgi:hypothetical protein
MALQIIGPGFGRTGTASVKIALEHLGFGPAHHMFEIRDNPALLPAWQAVADGAAPDWDEMFRGYGAQVDWPGARYWRELAGYYPQARVVLTVRDPDEWFDSIQATIAPFIAGRGSHPDPHANAIAEMGHKLVVEGVFGDALDDRAAATRIFRDHITEVKDTIPAGRLLVWDLREGWAPLCQFLGCEVPGISLPRLNSSKQFVSEEWAGEAAR